MKLISILELLWLPQIRTNLSKMNRIERKGKEGTKQNSTGLEMKMDSNFQLK